MVDSVEEDLRRIWIITPSGARSQWTATSGGILVKEARIHKFILAPQQNFVGPRPPAMISKLPWHHLHPALFRDYFSVISPSGWRVLILHFPGRVAILAPTSQRFITTLCRDVRPCSNFCCIMTRISFISKYSAIFSYV